MFQALASPQSFMELVANHLNESILKRLRESGVNVLICLNGFYVNGIALHFLVNVSEW